MDEAWQQQIRARALAIWQREGRPAGDPDQFNAMAEQELVAEGQTPSSSPLDESPTGGGTRQTSTKQSRDCSRRAIRRHGPVRAESEGQQTAALKPHSISNKLIILSLVCAEVA